MSRFHYTIQSISLLVVGFGLGWLTGLSVSPVVSTVLTSIVGVVIALVSILSGISAPEVTTTEQVQNRFKWRADPVPLAFLMAGIIGGSTVGILARTHNWLGVGDEPPTLQAEIQRWTAVGIKKEVVAQRLFDLEYPPCKAKGGSEPPSDTTVLFDDPHDECLRLRTVSDAMLKKDLSVSTIEVFQPLPSLIEDTVLLRKVVESQCELFGKN